MRNPRRLGHWTAVWALMISGLSPANEGPPDPEVLYAQRCSVCHSLGVLAPTREQLGNLTAEEIEGILWRGVMMEYANGLNAAERGAIARMLAEQQTVKLPRDSGVELCADSQENKRPADIHWHGFGPDNTFARFVADEQALDGAGVDLQVKWALGFPKTTAFTGVGNQIAAADDTLYVGNLNGWVYALDAQRGCAKWTFRAEGRVRSNVTINSKQIVFGDLLANVYSLDVATGALQWRTRVDEQPSARVTGNVTLHGDQVLVPVSGMQEVIAMRMDLPCCTFRGSVVALDAATGAKQWKTWMVEQSPQWLGKNKHGTDRYGPSGVPVWSGISVDEARGVAYVSTANQFTEPVVAESDAVIALDLKSGAKRWIQSLAPEQMGGQDIYHLACEAWFDKERAACSPENPEGHGDRDFGAPPILLTRPDGRQIVAAGSKDGMLYGLDPDANGAVLWQTRVGRGGEIGGIEYGIASDGTRVYAPVVDMDADGHSNGSLTAVDSITGAIIWRVDEIDASCDNKASPPCGTAFVSPPTVAGNTVIAGLVDGTVRAYDASTGREQWRFDTARPFETVNGVQANGGSLGIGGPVVIGSRVYLTSGWGIMNTGIPGNVLLVLEKKQ